jgi:hypothetical protein
MERSTWSLGRQPRGVEEMPAHPLWWLSMRGATTGGSSSTRGRRPTSPNASSIPLRAVLVEPRDATILVCVSGLIRGVCFLQAKKKVEYRVRYIIKASYDTIIVGEAFR